MVKAILLCTSFLLVLGCPNERRDPARVEEPARQVDVRLTEFEIQMPDTMPAARTTFRVTNAGTMEHTFQIEGEGVDESLGRNLEPGESATLTADLRPGSYRVWCPLGDHADRGMRKEIRVTENNRREPR